MAQINVYLSFDGNCREAMTFYKECLGGKLTLQSIGESPMADQWPPDAHRNILHSTLVRDSIVLMASDLSVERSLVKGNSISLSLSCDDKAEIEQIFGKLATGGQIVHPLHEFFAGTMGTLTDKYEKDWLLYCERKQPIQQ